MDNFMTIDMGERRKVFSGGQARCVESPSEKSEKEGTSSVVLKPGKMLEYENINFCIIVENLSRIHPRSRTFLDLTTVRKF